MPPRGSEIFVFETWQRRQVVPRKRKVLAVRSVDPVHVDPNDKHTKARGARGDGQILDAANSPFAQLRTDLVAFKSQKHGELKWPRQHRQQRPQKPANSAADAAYTTKVKALGLLHTVMVDGQAITIEFIENSVSLDATLEKRVLVATL